MKVSLKQKIILISLIVNTVISFVIGLVLYNIAGDLFLQSYLKDTMTLTKQVAHSIDGDIHKTLTNSQSVGGEYYKHLLASLNSVLHSDNRFTYLYTLNYNAAKDEFMYAVDSDILNQDVLWVETKYFAISVVGSNAAIVAEWNGTMHPQGLSIAAENRLFMIAISNKNELWVNGVRLFEMVSESPSVYRTISNTLDTKKTACKSVYTISGEPVEVYYTLTFKSNAASRPGDVYIESDKMISEMKKVFASGEDTILGYAPLTSIYGDTVSVLISLIRDKSKKPVGMVCVEVYEKESLTMKRDILTWVVFVILCIFIVNTLFSFVLASYIVKPVKKIAVAVREIASGNLKTIVDWKSNDEFGYLARGFNSMTQTLLENTSNLERSVSERTSQLEDALETLRNKDGIMEKDLKLAKSIMAKLLPASFEMITDLIFTVKYIPIAVVGGDVYDVYRMKDGKVRIFLGDTTGHGISAALVTMIIKNEYDRYKNLISEPCELLNYFNDEFLSLYTNLNIFFTCIVIDIDFKKKQMIYSSAGHPTQFLLKEGEIIPMVSSGKMVGIEQDVQYTQKTIKFGDSFSLFLYTDGLTEEFNPMGEEFGEDRLKELLNKHIEKDVRDIAEFVLMDVYEFIGENSVNDDITIFGVEWNKAKPAVSEQTPTEPEDKSE